MLQTDKLTNIQSCQPILFLGCILMKAHPYTDTAKVPLNTHKCIEKHTKMLKEFVVLYQNYFCEWKFAIFTILQLSIFYIGCVRMCLCCICWQFHQQSLVIFLFYLSFLDFLVRVYWNLPCHYNFWVKNVLSRRNTFQDQFKAGNSEYCTLLPSILLPTHKYRLSSKVSEIPQNNFAHSKVGSMGS